MKKINEKYIAKATGLSEHAAEQILSRIRGKILRRVDDKNLSDIEAIALQLEIEEEQLNEWRENRVKINKKYKKS